MAEQPTTYGAAGFDRALGVLEFDKVCAMLADCAHTEGARRAALGLRPSDDARTVRRLQQETSDARMLIGLKGTPAFSGVLDMSDALDRADRGAVLSMRELLDIAAIWHTARTLRDYYTADREYETSIGVYFSRLEENRSAESRITRAILSEDMMADEASPALADIRRKMRSASGRIKETLQRYISGGYSKYLQENIVTQRGGRFVVPVKSEHKNEIKGLVHDTSASGATLFIEPMAVVEANNELRELEVKERREMERILSELSVMCASHAPALTLNYYNITEIALIFARGELSYRMDGAAPKIEEQPLIELRRARHPLLDRGKVVPIDVRLGTDFDILVITGPNTGGKTVTLKTLGLFVLMAQAGLHLPAGEGSVVGIFDSVLANIGDEQSIEQSLSTFSAHMVSIVDITKRAGRGSLVLFDELGAGTDPVEGAALAVSILERVRESGALCAATTHYAELKEFALDTDGVCNAGCEFDLESLRPTYRLIIGAPGKSNAFAISRKLGLDEEIVRRAESYVGGENRRFESVIAGLEESRADMERERAEAKRLREELESYKKTEEERLRVEYGRVERELERQRAKAMGMVESAKAAGDYIMSELEEVKRHKDDADLGERMSAAKQNIRRRLRQVDNKINPVSEKVADEDYVLPRKLRAGDEVTVMSLGKSGEVVSVPDKGDNVTVKVGIITTRVPIKDLRLAEDTPSGFLITEDKKKKAIKPGTKELRTAAFSPEIDIRGETGEDGWFIVDRYLDDAKMAGVKTVTVVHGKGTGALKKALWQFLRSDRRVKSYRTGEYGEGDGGVTVIELK